MKQQIVIIGGGTAFETYDDYLNYLNTCEVSIKKLTTRTDWKNTLSQQLGEGYEVLLPRMPNKTNARYNEWELYFRRIAPLLNDGVIIVGHSLGGIFLARYLSTNIFPKKITATILVAAPYDYAGTDNNKESLTEFALPSSLQQFTRQAGKIYLIHSVDDPIVPFTELKKHQRFLTGAHIVTFKNRGHFNQKTFPEIVNIIQSLYR